MPPADPYRAARSQMLNQHLQDRDIHSQRVLDAMARVAREIFVSPGEESLAYDDRALAIDCGQTISQPFIVALMSQALELSGGERVLEIGTGSGYQTAILAELAGEVFTIERHASLLQQAKKKLNQLGYLNVHFKVGDGATGWPQEAPFDRIMITAAAERCPKSLWEQLAEGGILIGPFGPSDKTQYLQTIRKIAGHPQTKTLSACRFVPLISEQENPNA